MVLLNPRILLGPATSAIATKEQILARLIRRQAAVPLFNPRKDNWHEHFGWQGVRIGGLTPTGRATALLLQMNAERRLERRAELIKRGWF